jgi:hypothetical protein
MSEKCVSLVGGGVSSRGKGEEVDDARSGRK